MLFVAGLVFGCGGDDAATDGGHDHVHGEEDSGAFEAAANNLGVVFNAPVAAGRPSPSFNADILPILTNRCAIPGCHVAGGPYDIDLRTYGSVIKGGDDQVLSLLQAMREQAMREQAKWSEEIVGGQRCPLKWTTLGGSPDSNSSSIGLMRVPRITSPFQYRSSGCYPIHPQGLLIVVK